MRVSILTRGILHTSTAVPAYTSQLVPQLHQVRRLGRRRVWATRVGATARGDLPRRRQRGTSGCGNLGRDVRAPRRLTSSAHLVRPVLGHPLQALPGHPARGDGTLPRARPPWKVEQLGGGTASPAGLRRRPTRRRTRSSRSRGHDHKHPERLPVRGREHPRRQERHRHRGFKPDHDTDVLERLGSPRQPAGGLRGQITRQKGLIHLVRAANEFDRTPLSFCSPAHPTPEIAAEFNSAFAGSTSGVGRCSGSRDAVARGRSPGQHARRRVRLPLDLRTPRHREPQAMACGPQSWRPRSGHPRGRGGRETGLLVPHDPAGRRRVHRQLRVRVRRQGERTHAGP